MGFNAARLTFLGMCHQLRQLMDAKMSIRYRPEELEPSDSRRA
jgi:hypothetical protein